MITRRNWITGSLAAIPAVCLNAANSDVAADLDIIDCHTHFFDPTRPKGIPWPGKDSPLYRTILPKHLRELKTFRPLTGTVIVEASPRLEDNAWLLEIAKDDPFVVGIVGNLEPGGPDFAENLKRFAANPLFRGIRVSVQLVEQLLEADSLGDLQRLADHDLALDVNGGPETPGVVGQLAGKLPELRIVQNHIGNVPVSTDAPPADWQAGIRAAATHPNVFCKISALLESAWAVSKSRTVPRDLAFYRPYLDVVWNAFGDDRVIYGSNWPVSEKASDYATLQRIYLEYASEKGEEATRKFCAPNSKKAYAWAERAGRL
ncbi:MAG: L-fuconolactonase [Verrucomicrobiales bacterium]|jgi:L-fuconolactonase